MASLQELLVCDLSSAGITITDISIVTTVDVSDLPQSAALKDGGKGY